MRDISSNHIPHLASSSINRDPTALHYFFIWRLFVRGNTDTSTRTSNTGNSRLAHERSLDVKEAKVR
jgi:hypothetical protein